MKILLISGHGAGDVGACGCGYQEYALTRELVNNIAPKLRKHATVDIYDQSRNAFYDCQNGTFNIGAYDYVFEVHFNACVNDQNGNGQTTGTEIYVTSSEEAVTVEQSIIDKVSACGLRNRGVKVTDFLVIRTIKNKGISSALIETCFIDDRDDMNVYVAKKNEIAQAITNGIVEGFGLNETSDQTIKPVEPTKPITPPNQSGTGFNVNETVTLSNNATVYQGASTGVAIPQNVKGKNYTVQQISSDGRCLLLKEIFSWVLTSECSKKNQATQPTLNALKVGQRATPKTPFSYTGVKLISSVTTKSYPVIEIVNDRVVLGDGLNTAFNINNLDY